MNARVWKHLEKDKIKQDVFAALENNLSLKGANVMGIPGSNLDPRVFYHDAPFLKDAPFLTSMILNPNHIGCHTLGEESEPFFAGTQAIEREVLEICAEDILKAERGTVDGYVASGGTEANIQAAWIYRNYFQQEKGASPSEIAIICSADNHYSAAKAANVLNIRFFRVGVDDDTRRILPTDLESTLDRAQEQGVKYFIVIANLMTTMFGSVDRSTDYTAALKRRDLPYFLHVDGAYGGFVYPFTDQEMDLDFSNPEVTSITLDAHKMVQAPYGTGVFLIRSGWMKYVRSSEASYVKGLDATLIGSRSGANAVAIWMILSTYGPQGWKDKIQTLCQRAERIADALAAKGIRFFREKGSNIVSIRAGQLPQSLVSKYHLVPDDHDNPQWVKIVVMDHVDDEMLEMFLGDLANCS
jgi:tyrosine decarboxylase/aspartate 1-decarboxylase